MPLTSPTDKLDSLLRSCCKQTGLDGAGVSMVTAAGAREPLHATDVVSKEIERLQFTLGEGPCVDASRAGGPVLVADLTDESDHVAAGWPVFRTEALRAGARAVFAFPVRVGAVSLGAVDMYRSTRGGLSDDQVGTALTSVDRLGVALLDHPTGYRDHDPGAVSDPLVHQAAGMVMIQLDTRIEEALVRLRAAAFAEGRTVSELASDVVHRRRRLAKEDR